MKTLRNIVSLLLFVLCAITLCAQQTPSGNCDIIKLTSGDSVYGRNISIVGTSITYDPCFDTARKNVVINKFHVTQIIHPDRSFINIDHSKRAIEDTVPSKHILGFGSGYSLGFEGGSALLGYPVKSNIDESTVFSNIVPPICVTYDYQNAKHGSVGAALTYQNEKVGQFYGRITDNLTRVNIGFRALLLLGDEDLQLELGSRLGLSFWWDNCSIKGREFIQTSFEVVPSLQPLIVGLRLYVTDEVGIDGELTLGSPYLWQAGLLIRLTSSKK